MKVDFKKPGHWILLIQQSLYTLIAIGVRCFRPKPQKPLVILYGHQLSGNLKALYQYGSGHHADEIDLYYLSLDPDYSAQLRRNGVRVLQCNRLRDMLQLSQASAFISDHGLHLMTPLVRFTDIVFIDVWHGIPFKGFVPGDFKLQRRFDEVWVSSPLLKRIYEEKFGFDAAKVRSLGYARTDRLFYNEELQNSLKETIGVPPANKVVLYAPTWQQDESGRKLFPFDQSEQAFISCLDETCASHGATLVIRSHLNTELGEEPSPHVRYCSQRNYPDTEALLLLADILICDWSSIAFDYLALNRPTVFLETRPPFNHGFTLGREYRYGKIIRDMSSLQESLHNYLSDPEQYLNEHIGRHQAITEELYGSNTDGLVAQRQLERVRQLI